MYSHFNFSKNIAKYLAYEYWRLKIECLLIKQQYEKNVRYMCKLDDEMHDIITCDALNKYQERLQEYKDIISRVEKHIITYNSYLREALDKQFNSYSRLGGHFYHFATLLQNLEILKKEYKTNFKIFKHNIHTISQKLEELRTERKKVLKHMQYIQTKLNDRHGKIQKYDISLNI